MQSYPKTYDPIRQYGDAIKRGEINACAKIKTITKKLIWDLDHPARWHYDATRGNHVIEFFENFLIPSKTNTGGKPIRLELWEHAYLAATFGFVDDQGLRRYQRTILIVAKKNGKSYLASGTGLYLLMADGEPGPEIYSVATKRDQARIIWDEAWKMRRKSPLLLKATEKTVSEIRCDANEGIFKPLASDSNTLDGLNVHGVLMDEFHQWRDGMKLYNILADGVSAREQPLIMMTSTAGDVRDDIYDEIYGQCEDVLAACDQIVHDGASPTYDERTLPFIYELDARTEMDDPACWIKANPNLGVSKKLEYLADKVKASAKSKKQKKNTLCKEFNMPETAGEAALTWEQINITETIDLAILRPRYVIGGFDLSETIDLTSACRLFTSPDGARLYFQHMYWMPEDRLKEHVETDRVPYDAWAEQGYLRLCPGNQIDPGMVKDWFMETQEDQDMLLQYIGFDAWSAQYLVTDMEDYVGKNVMEPVRQGARTLSVPTAELLAAFERRAVVIDNNPLTKYCLRNLRVKYDSNGNVLPVKVRGGPRRIDGFMAMLDAFVAYSNHRDEYLKLID